MKHLSGFWVVIEPDPHWMAQQREPITIKRQYDVIAPVLDAHTRNIIAHNRAT